MKIKRPHRKIVYRKKINILLVEIVNRNLGDMVIAESTSYLVQRALPYFLRKHCVLRHYNIASEDYEMVQTADLIIFVGGGIIKYRQEKLYPYVEAIVDCAREWQIPVYFNCVGVEGYDEEDERCQALKRVLNYDCIKSVTIRDDFDTFQNYYLDNQMTKLAPAIDPVVYLPEVYGRNRDTSSHTVGLGIARWRIFEDYGISEVDRQFQLDLWKGIIDLLEERGYQWKLFVNGLRSDYDFALEILEYVGRQGDEYLIQRPAFTGELVDAVASFEAVIACRMHANIIAYAMGIPSIGMVWNDKMLFWGERIGYPERFLKKEEFVSEIVVDRMEQGIREGVRPCSSQLRRAVYNPLRSFVRQYVSAAWKTHRSEREDKVVVWRKRMVATALGGIQQRYINMNTPQGLSYSMEQGFLNFEADVRLTTDEKLVCVNGWSRGSYEKLGLDPEKYDQQGLDYDMFMACRMYDGHFETMDLPQLLGKMQEVETEWKLILDIGKPGKEVLSVMIARLQELCEKTAVNPKKVFIRLQTRYDVEQVQEAGLPVSIMFYIAPKDKREEKNLTLDSIGRYCKKRGIKWVSMSREAMDEEVMDYVKRVKLKSCVFSLNTYTEILQGLSLGVDWIASSCRTVKELEDLHEQRKIIII